MVFCPSHVDLILKRHALPTTAPAGSAKRSGTRNYDHRSKYTVMPTSLEREKRNGSGERFHIMAMLDDATAQTNQRECARVESSNMTWQSDGVTSPASKPPRRVEN